MKSLVYNSLGFLLFKLLIRPFKRTLVRWSVVLITPSGQIAVRRDEHGTSLPSGEVRPGIPIPELCHRALGLTSSAVDPAAPLRLLGAVGRGCESMTVYFAADLVSDRILRPAGELLFVDKAMLASLVPAEIMDRLR
jgi:hypothetical protein